MAKSKIRDQIGIETKLSRPGKAAKPIRARSTTAVSEAVDDYLKAIFQLSGREERQVASTEVAHHLAVTGASVTNMLQKLAAAAAPLVVYRKHHGVKLSKAGKTRALEIIRHHRLIETFLHQVLGYPWDEVHQEAERLEHFISERFEERIAAKLGNPEFDPHGHPIPALDGSMPGNRPNNRPSSRGGKRSGAQPGTPAGSRSVPEPQALSQLASGKTARVMSVSDRDPGMLRYLAAQGVRPGVRLIAGEQLPFKGSFQVRVGRASSPTLLSDSLAAAILVIAT